MPWNLTEVPPVRFVPVMITWVPTGPLVRVKDVIVGRVVVTSLKATMREV